MTERKCKRQIAIRWLGQRLAGVLHACLWAHRMPRYVNPATRPVNHCLLEKFVSPGDVCLDVGANAGSWSYPMAKRVGCTGYTHAFDVFPYYAKVLERALWLRRVRNVKVHAVGLGDADGDRAIALVDASGEVLSGMIHLAGEEEPQEKIVVPIRKLDTIMSEDPSLLRTTFVKIDVEGSELAIFRGASKMLDIAKPVIYCEIVDSYCRRYGHRLVDVVDYLMGAGYRPFALTEDGGLTPVDQRAQNPPHDFVFIPDQRCT